MTVRLRGHHLLCLLTYAGCGYDAAFVAGMDEVVRRLEAGEEVRLVAGADDICASLLARHDDPHCRLARVTGRDAAALEDLQALLGGSLAPGARVQLDAATVARLRAAFATGRTRRACAGCEWAGLCTGLAARDFAGTRLFTPPRAG